jgi:hypothetical protein
MGPPGIASVRGALSHEMTGSLRHKNMKITGIAICSEYAKICSSSILKWFTQDIPPFFFYSVISIVF